VPDDMTMTDLPPAAATALLRRTQDIIILSKTASVIIDEFDLNPIQNLLLTARVLAATLDRLAQELIGPGRELTDEEVKLGSDFIDSLPDDLHSIDQFMGAYKGRLELIR